MEIIGDRVDLDQARIRSESTIIIKAKELKNNRLPQVEAPFLVYDLGTAAPELVAFQRTGGVGVHRFHCDADRTNGEGKDVVRWCSRDSHRPR